MTGMELKAILKRTGRPMTDIAEMINVSPQTLNQTFKSQDVKSGMIEAIARALQIDIKEFYGSNGNVMVTDHSTIVNGSVNNTNANQSDFVKLLNKKDEQIDRLLTIIETLNK